MKENISLIFIDIIIFIESPIWFIKTRILKIADKKELEEMNIYDELIQFRIEREQEERKKFLS